MVLMETSFYYFHNCSEYIYITPACPSDVRLLSFSACSMEAYSVVNETGTKFAKNYSNI